MSRQRRKPTKTPTATPKRTGKPVNVWVPDELREALDEVLEETRRHLTSEVIIALESHCAKFGKWPRKQSKAE